MAIRPWLLSTAFAICLIGGIAHADDKELARQQYLEGTRRYDLNEFAPALEAFKRAYMAYEDPAFLYNIAQCERQLGNKAEAVKFYRSYLRKVPDAPNRDEVSAIIVNLEAAIRAEQAAAPQPHAPPATPTAVPLVASSPTVMTAQPLQARTPVYKKWWLWTIVGVAAAGAAAGVAIAITSQRTESSFMPVTVSR